MFTDVAKAMTALDKAIEAVRERWASYDRLRVITGKLVPPGTLPRDSKPYLAFMRWIDDYRSAKNPPMPLDIDIARATEAYIDTKRADTLRDDAIHQAFEATAKSGLTKELEDKWEFLYCITRA